MMLPQELNAAHAEWSSEALGWELSAVGLRQAGEQKRRLSTKSDDVGHGRVAALRMTFGQGMIWSRLCTHINKVHAQPSCDPDRFHVSIGMHLSQLSIERGLGTSGVKIPQNFDSTS